MIRLSEIATVRNVRSETNTRPARASMITRLRMPVRFIGPMLSTAPPAPAAASARAERVATQHGHRRFFRDPGIVLVGAAAGVPGAARGHELLVHATVAQPAPEGRGGPPARAQP